MINKCQWNLLTQMDFFSKSKYNNLFLQSQCSKSKPFSKLEFDTENVNKPRMTDRALNWAFCSNVTVPTSTNKYSNTSNFILNILLNGKCSFLWRTASNIQCIQRVFRPHYFFHILLCYSLILKCIKLSPLNLHTIPHNEKADTGLLF